jgi:uridine phosphorylase
VEWFSEGESVVKPEEFAPKDLGSVSLGIIVFVKRVYEWMKAATCGIAFEREEGVVGAKRFFVTKDGLAVFHSYFGAPATVALGEALIAAGVKNILIFGEAGSISSEVDIGQIVVPTFAIREEGVSYHYLSPNFEAKPSDNLLRNIKALLRKMNVPYKEGGVWTTDAPFRETTKKVLTYSKAGILAVEMECSALFCLSTYRKTNSVALLIITDTLWGGIWKPAFNEEKVVDVEKRISETLVTHWNKLISKYVQR